MVSVKACRCQTTKSFQGESSLWSNRLESTCRSLVSLIRSGWAIHYLCASHMDVLSNCLPAHVRILFFFENDQSYGRSVSQLDTNPCTLKPLEEALVAISVTSRYTSIFPIIGVQYLSKAYIATLHFTFFASLISVATPLLPALGDFSDIAERLIRTLKEARQLTSMTTKTSREARDRHRA